MGRWSERCDLPVGLSCHGRRAGAPATHLCPEGIRSVAALPGLGGRGRRGPQCRCSRRRARRLEQPLPDLGLSARLVPRCDGRHALRGEPPEGAQPPENLANPRLDVHLHRGRRLARNSRAASRVPLLGGVRPSRRPSRFRLRHLPRASPGGPALRGCRDRHGPAQCPVPVQQHLGSELRVLPAVLRPRVDGPGCRLAATGRSVDPRPVPRARGAVAQQRPLGRADRLGRHRARQIGDGRTRPAARGGRRRSSGLHGGDLRVPLGGLVSNRLDNPTSNDTRASLGIATVESVVQGSPVVGFGTTRDVQGTFTSIAGGSTSECPQCSPPALGTQGHLWLVVFSQGLIGAALYLSFYARALWRSRRILSDEVTVGIVAIGAHLTTMFVYDSIGMSMVAVGVGVAYLWREELRVAPTSQEATLGAYLGLLRRHWLPVTACVAIGLSIAAGVQSRQGRASGATVSMLLPPEPPYLSDRHLDTSMDTEGALAHSSSVLKAMSEWTGHRVTTDEVFVSADPNSRVLNIRFVGPGAPRTRDALMAAADVVLTQRAQRLSDAKQRVETEITAHRSDLTDEYLTVDRAVTLVDVFKPAGAPVQLPGLRQEQASIRTKISAADATLSQISATPFDAGTVIKAPRPTRHRDGWIIGLTAGGMLGLLVGLLVAYYRDALGPLARDSGALYRRLRAPVLWSGDPDRAPSELDAAVRPFGELAFASADQSSSSALLVHRLAGARSHGGPQPSSPMSGRQPGRSSRRHSADPRTVLVITAGSPVRRAERLADRLRAAGHDIAGAIVIERRRRTTPTDHHRAVLNGLLTRFER